MRCQYDSSRGPCRGAQGFMTACRRPVLDSSAFARTRMPTSSTLGSAQLRSARHCRPTSLSTPTSSSHDLDGYTAGLSGQQVETARITAPAAGRGLPPPDIVSASALGLELGAAARTLRPNEIQGAKNCSAYHSTSRPGTSSPPSRASAGWWTQVRRTVLVVRRRSGSTRQPCPAWWESRLPASSGATSWASSTSPSTFRAETSLPARDHSPLPARRSRSTTSWAFPS